MKPQYFLFIICLLLGFQNCSLVTFDGNHSNANNSQQSSGGGGDSYDGKPKPGKYYRTIPNFKCAADVNSQATMTVTSDSISLRSISADCTSPLQQNLAFSEIDYKSFQPDLLGFKDGAYLKLDTPPDLQSPSEVIEAFCSTEQSSPTSGIAIAIYSSFDGRALRGAVSTLASSLLITDLERSVVVGEASYKTTDFALTITVGSKLGDQFQGQLTRGGQTQTLACRFAGALDPLAPLNPPAMSFAIEGVRGGSDIVADRFLTDRVAPQVSLQLTPSAAEYRASITDPGSGAVVCPEVNSLLPLVQMRCSLSAMRTYETSASITTLYGQTFAANNNPFLIEVPQVSTSAVSVAPTQPQAGQAALFSATLTSAINLNGVHVHFQVYDAAWKLIDEKYTNNENFTAGVPRVLTSPYTFPSTPGVYWLQVGVFNSSWTQNLGGTMTNLFLIL